MSVRITRTCKSTGPAQLVWHRRQTVVHVGDGLSNTFLASEVRTREQPRDQRGAWALAWNAACLLAFDMHPVGAANTIYRYNRLSLGVTQRPNTEGPNLDIVYACPDSAGAILAGMPCDVYDVPASNHYLSAARSRHPGGVNVVFLDGHLAFVRDQVDEIAMAYLVAIDDGVPAAVGD